MPVDELLYDAAVALIESRLPSADWATAAALRMDDGSIIVGIGFDNFNSGAGLCAEVGPIAQAYTEGRRVTGSICVNRSRDRQHDLVLAPCGLCQERLALWGPDVEVGVADGEEPRGWSSRWLKELNPYLLGNHFFRGRALADNSGARRLAACVGPAEQTRQLPWAACSSRRAANGWRRIASGQGSASGHQVKLEIQPQSRLRRNRNAA